MSNLNVIPLSSVAGPAAIGVSALVFLLVLLCALLVYGKGREHS